MEGVRFNEFIFVCLFRVCMELGSVKLGFWVYDYVLKNRFELGIYLGIVFVDMYSKCGSLDNVRKVFNMMEKRSLVIWNFMIISLGVYGYGEEVLVFFKLMMEEDVMFDVIIFVGVLNVCV